MARYILQEQNSNKEWVDTDVTLNTKLELDNHIGQYNVDYDWRVGFMFKPFDKPVSQFVWNTNAKKGQPVKV